ncbi:hypothetical protein ZOSMA_165G00260 [Zostera marina]|uniref:Uncharacterized protein n=1 Tax=Zostera marina TaxID=29655 RepID=A0A0K9PTU1_ZOSMR|nr:hypothetical protein ZOSMA_165G00260 [Zostera marina]
MNISDIEAENSDISVKTKLQHVLDCLEKPKQVHNTINKVETLLEINYNTPLSYYHPKIISIGPYHHGKNNLLSMENTKYKYLNNLLSRCVDKDRNMLDRFVEAACKMEENVRDCYGEVLVNIKQDEFLEMLVLDGCFLIEFLLKFHFHEVYQSMSMANWSIPLIRKDLLLLENQIPFSVLEIFYSISQIKEPSNIRDLAIEFLSNGTITSIPEQYHEIVPYHLLHLLHISLHPNFASNYNHDHVSTSSLLLQQIPFTWILSWLLKYVSGILNTNTNLSTAKLVPTAVELQNSGVKFKTVEQQDHNFLNIQFENGILKIPSLIINFDTVSLIVNLLAFEQSRADVGSYVTNYTAFMSSIVKTTCDVMALQSFHIIKRQLYNDDDVVIFFSRIGDREIRIWKEDDRNYLDGIIQKVNEFCNNPIYRFKVMVKRNFNKSKVIITLISTTAMLAYSAWKTIM